MSSQGQAEHSITRTDPGAQDILSGAWVVKLVFSGDAGLVDERRTVTADELRIGRSVDPLEGLALPEDDLASGTHARLSLDGERIRVRDAGSKNGTFVNGQRVSEGWLEDRDVLRIGASLLVIRREPADTQDAPAAARVAYDLLLGCSPEIAQVRHVIARVARESNPVLLLGETGTGKERAAAAVHALSERRGALVGVNISTLTPSLAESELFGHEAGAYTGAGQRRPGLFREAAGGTLLLDEIGDLALALQPMLLRALENKVIRPVGGKEEPIDVRVIAATNHDLDADIAQDRFRSDLRARLAVHLITLPPLRDRREDILLLFAHYLGGQRRLSARLCEALLLYPWSENVLELVNLTRHVQTFVAAARVIDLPMVIERLRPATEAAASPLKPPEPPPDSRPPEQRHRVHYTRDMVERLLSEHQGILSRVEKAIGVSRRQLLRKLHEWGIDPERFRRRKK